MTWGGLSSRVWLLLSTWIIKFNKQRKKSFSIPWDYCSITCAKLHQKFLIPFFFFGQGWSLPASAGIKACTTMLRGGRFLCLFYASNSYQSHVAILYVYCNWSFHFLILFSWRYLRLGQAGLCRTHIVPTFLCPMEAEFHTPYAALELTL